MIMGLACLYLNWWRSMIISPKKTFLAQCWILLYSTHSCVIKPALIPQSEPVNIATPLLPLLQEWMMYIHRTHQEIIQSRTTHTSQRNSSKTSRFDNPIHHTFTYIYIYLASEVLWTPSILWEPTNKKVLRHRTLTRVATSKSGLQSLDTIRLWEVLIKNTKKILRKKRKKTFLLYP